jgi:hypothetical protein
MVNLLTGLFAIYVCSPHTYRKVQPASRGGKSTKWRRFFILKKFVIVHYHEQGYTVYSLLV